LSSKRKNKLAIKSEIVKQKVDGGKQGAQTPVHIATKADNWESKIKVKTTFK